MKIEAAAAAGDWGNSSPKENNIEPTTGGWGEAVEPAAAANSNENAWGVEKKNPAEDNWGVENKASTAWENNDEPEIDKNQQRKNQRRERDNKS